MLKKSSLLLSVFLIIGTLTGCKSNKVEKTEVKAEESKKIEVVVSFNPLKEFAEAIGKDKVNVRTIVPEGMEAHDFEPKAKDIENVNKANVFVYNGLGMESWVENVLKSADNKSLTVVESSKGIDPIKSADVHNEEEEHNEKHENEHGEFDPHVWLSIREAKIQAKNITEALVKVDNSNEDFYESNYNDFALKLDNLYVEYKAKFDTVKNKNFVTGHAAFAYLCRDLGLVQNSVEDVFAEGEPTGKRITELVEYCKQNNIKVVFMEEFASPKVSETLAKEVGAKVEKIYTIESREDDKDYIQSMEENLKRIYESLK